MPKIFVQIAAFRDPELNKTIENCLEKASSPEDLVFSICWQHDPKDEWDTLDRWKGDPRFKVIDILDVDSKGACWARNLLQQQYAGEEYTLQIDSHMRFIQDWDKEMIEMHRSLVESGVEKPLITTYATEFFVDRDTDLKPEPWRMDFDRFAPDGVVHTRPATPDNWQELTEPVPARFYSAHYAFAYGAFVEEVPHDPEYYFHGEEISVGVRAYTWGYDLFHPHKSLIWHEYTRRGKPHHWDYVPGWGDHDHRSHEKNRELFGIGCERVDFGKYGFGPVRPLEDFERFAGIRFKDMTVQKWTVEHRDPPNPYLIGKAYEDSFLKFYKHYIDIQYVDVPEKDYLYWVVAFHSKDGDTLYRKDADRAEIDGYFKDVDKYCKILREFYYDKPPAYWVVWPFSEKKGWCNRLTGDLQQVLEKPHASISEIEESDPEIPGFFVPENIGSDLVPGHVSDDTIFIQIASFRDSELKNTIKDCLKNARRPLDLVFCIAWQHSPDDAWDNLDEFLDDPRFIILDIDLRVRETLGVCWARNQMQQWYRGEKYTLQLDSHHRFVDGWDDVLIGMIKRLQYKGFKKPLLTAYLPSYDPSNDPAGRNNEPWKMEFDRFTPEGAVFFYPAGVPDWQNLEYPVRGRFYSAHFCFTLGAFCEEVQHDPHIVFHGEEISIAVRAYTCGYDIFHPHKMVAWHEYSRNYRRKVWDDDKDWEVKHKIGLARNRAVLGIDGTPRPRDLGRYGFGTIRTQDDYEAYAGIRFKDRAIQKETVENVPPPNPVYENKEDYDKSFLHRFKHCIDIQYSQVPLKDYDFWVVEIQDKDGKGLFRKDSSYDDIKGYFSDPDRYCKIWMEFYYDEGAPAKWLVWPHSKSQEWCDKIEGVL